MTISKAMKEHINSMSYEDLVFQQKHADPRSLILHGEAGEYFNLRMQELKKKPVVTSSKSRDKAKVVSTEVTPQINRDIRTFRMPARKVPNK